MVNARNFMAIAASFFIAATPLPIGAQGVAAPTVDDSYARLSASYGSGTPASAAPLFLPDVAFTRFSAAAAPDTTVGAGDAIAALAQAELPAEVRFRISSRLAGAGRTVDAGVLRVRATGPAAREDSHYARFALVFERSPGGEWQIRSGATAPADLYAFEDAAGDLLPAGPERLSAEYYGNLTGTYRSGDGCRHEVSRSSGRLLVHDVCTGQFRALRRIAGRSYEAGRTVAALPPFGLSLTFPGSSRDPTATLVLAAPGAPPRIAAREATYRAEEVAFTSRDGTGLAGTLLVPTGGAPHPAVVLVHGSGPQDRHGEASMIDVLARRFVHAGFAVLQYDKRGVGGSAGDWRIASFATLAEDALAGRTLLMARPDVIRSAVGIAGGSQAGWITAKAVTAEPELPFVLLLGAGGSALDVQEQNAYNVGVTMACLGISPSVSAEVLRQHRLYYQAEREPRRRQALAGVTAALARDARLEPFLMPATVDRSDPTAWYVAMETDFDPLPVWRRYRGSALFAFGDRDDQTPAAIAADRLRRLGNSRFRIVRSPVAQHHGFVAEDVCRVGFDQVSRFDPLFWDPIQSWIERLAARLEPRPRD